LPAGRSADDVNREEVATAGEDDRKLRMLRAIVTTYPRKRESRRPESTLLVPGSPTVVAQ
jgi:hypothetical protein